MTRLFEEMWLKGDLSAVDELVASDYMLYNDEGLRREYYPVYEWAGYFLLAGFNQGNGTSTFLYDLT